MITNINICIIAGFSISTQAYKTETKDLSAQTVTITSKVGTPNQGFSINFVFIN